MSELARDNWVQELAYEVALEYEPPSSLEARFGLAAGSLDPASSAGYMARDPHFRASVEAYRRQMDEGSVQARMKVKRLASLMVEQAAEIAVNPAVDPPDRLKAIEMLCRYAGLVPKNVPVDAEAEGPEPFTINIQVNTQVNS